MHVMRSTLTLIVHNGGGMCRMSLEELMSQYPGQITPDPNSPQVGTALPPSGGQDHSKSVSSCEPLSVFSSYFDPNQEVVITKLGLISMMIKTFYVFN